MHTFIHNAIRNAMDGNFDPIIRKCEWKGIEFYNMIADLETLDKIVDRSEIDDVIPDGAAVLVVMRAPADCSVGGTLPDAAGGVTFTHVFTLRLVHESKWHQLVLNEVTVQ